MTNQPINQGKCKGGKGKGGEWNKREGSGQRWREGKERKGREGRKEGRTGLDLDQIIVDSPSIRLTHM